MQDDASAGQWLALNMDPAGCQTMEWRSQEVRCDSLPPAALLPRFAFEPLRGDLSCPAHMRGSGLDWPPEARAGNGSVGRWPMAYAWSGLRQGAQWRWEPEGQPIERSAADAIAATIGAVVLRCTGDARVRPRTVVVVANDLPEAAQQRLLDSCSALGLDVKLLWRPIAAALVWLSRFGGSLLEESKGTLASSKAAEVPLGRLITFHMGIECAEATCLSLVARRQGGTWRVLPGRHRPDPGGTAHGAGRRTVERLVAGLAQRSGLPASASAHWNLHWCTPRLSEALANLRQPLSAATKTVHDLWREACSGSSARMAEFKQVEQLPTPEASGRSALDALRSAAAKLGSDRLLGAIVTGPLGATRLGAETLAEHHLAQAGLKPEKLLLEGGSLECGALAVGAGLFADALGRSSVPYLDTLPLIRLAVAVKGEPSWRSLLVEGERWVNGGQVWTRSPNFPNLQIPASSEALDINLVHDEFKTVRRVRVALPARSSRAVPASLAVSMEPAQGNARVELIPEDRGLFGKRRVWVEWHRMEDTKQDPDSYLSNEYPRIFPPPQSRLASALTWRRTFDVLGPIVTRWEKVGHGPTRSELHELGDLIKAPDQQYYPRAATSVDSNGSPPAGERGHKDLGTLTSRLLDRLLAIRAETDEAQEIVRFLGYSSTADPRFEKFLLGRLRLKDTRLPQHEVEAIGWILREPAGIADYARVLLDRCAEGTGTNVWVKSFASVLRARADATAMITSQIGHRLCEALIALFVAEREKGKGNFIFRNSCMSIVYLLRRRAHDDDFLDPESSLAKRIKQEFAEAARAKRERRLDLMGGSVDLPAELQRLIDYIDRHGHGLPGLGE